MTESSKVTLVFFFLFLLFSGEGEGEGGGVSSLWGGAKPSARQSSRNCHKAGKSPNDLTAPAAATVVGLGKKGFVGAGERASRRSITGERSKPVLMYGWVGKWRNSLGIVSGEGRVDRTMMMDGGGDER